MQKSKFIVGESYSRRSICDSDCIFYIKIISRSSKMVTAEDSFGHTRRYKILDIGDAEYIKAGNYSMAGGWSSSNICKTEETAPVTPEELSSNFSAEELQFIADVLKEFLEPQETEELPANCVPFRRKVA